MIRPGRGGYGYERALARAGLSPVAGADEAGRGACAGPLVAAAVILDPARPIKGLDDSKVLSPAKRQELHDEILSRAVAVASVRVEHDECDRLGMHQADLHALRRAVARLSVPPAFVLTDGFPVDGLGVPGLGIWKGDKVAACVSAASIVAKVTRDAIMTEYDATHPNYGFAIHKGYCTAAHQAALEEHGPCDIHRWCFDNVARTARVVPS
ncbi:ribonuclease HII [Tessaracoccus sp.]